VTAEKIILDMKNMDPMDAMKEANKVLKREGKYKNLKEEDVERIMEDTNDFIFGRDIPEDPEGFAVGGRVGMAGGGILKLAMKFFNDNNPVSAYKKYLKYVKETAQKDPAKLAPEMGGIVVGSELIHRGLRRKLKEAKEKNDTDDSEDTTTEDRTEKAGGGVSQGLDYLMGIERRGYQEGSVSQEGVIPGFEKIRDTVYFNPDGTPNLEKIKAANFLAGSSINEFGYRDIKTGDTYGQSTYNDIAAGRYPRIFDPSKYTIGPDNNYYEVDSIITDGGLRYRINADGSRTLLDTATEQTTPTEDFSDYLNFTTSRGGQYAIEQTTPTEDFSDYLNTTTINTNVQTTPAVEEQMISPEDALTPPAPDVNPLQQHFDNDYLLKQAVASGEITPEQSNELGGYDVQQMLSPGNPLLGGIGNLIGSTLYNAAQSSLPANNLKDSFGNVIYEDTPFIIGEDANTIYSQTPRASQLLREIPGDVYRNVKGGLGLISPELKQTYRNIIQQRAPANIVENIDTAVSSLNPYQQQRYMNYALENPDRAIQAAQRDQDFRTSIERRDQKQKGGLSYLLGM
jgi:hypothetical protein